jgi:dCMP deaminase
LSEVVTDYTLRHLHRALEEAHKSPDPATQVGAIITTPSGHGVISWGCNTLPDGLELSVARLYHRETKLRLMVHAERNAILMAARAGRQTDGGTLYTVCTDATGKVWGGICVPCACEIIQAGIRRIVTFEHKMVSKWCEEWLVARSLFSEAGVEYVEVPNA